MRQLGDILPRTGVAPITKTDRLDMTDNKRQRKLRGQSRTDNLETLATVGTQDLGR